MNEGDWAELAIHIWLFAYILFFMGACVLLKKARTPNRWLFFSGTLLLVFVNVVLFVIAHDIMDMRYRPYYESTEWRHSLGHDPYFPQWQRALYWFTALADVLGKLLAGIGLLLEGRRQTNIMRQKQMVQFQTEAHHLTNS